MTSGVLFPDLPSAGRRRLTTSTSIPLNALVDDEALRITRAIGGGDRSALAAFYDEWFDRALCLASAVTKRDEAFCLDVAQESMMRVARSIPPLRTRADVERWMARVVHTAALDLLKAESRRARRERAAAARVAGVAPDRAAALSEEIDVLASRLRSLPAPDAHLLGLRFVRGMTHDHAARAEGATAGGVHGRIRRILAALRGSEEGGSR